MASIVWSEDVVNLASNANSTIAILTSRRASLTRRQSSRRHGVIEGAVSACVIIESEVNITIVTGSLVGASGVGIIESGAVIASSGAVCTRKQPSRTILSVGTTAASSIRETITNITGITGHITGRICGVVICTAYTAVGTRHTLRTSSGRIVTGLAKSTGAVCS